MKNNNQIILETLISQNREEKYPELNEDAYFNLFVSEQIMKDFELSYDELEEGIVDNSGDGGIDAIYTFVNDELIQRDTDLIDGKRKSNIDIYIIQSKNTNGFSETPIEKCNSSAIDLFDLSKSIKSLGSIYNNELLRNIEVFRKQYLHLASKFPILKFHYFYVSKGSEVHPNVERKVEILQQSILNHFDKAEVKLEFITAKKLIELSRKEQLYSKGIKLTDNPISTQDGGYIAIVPIKNYFDFITEREGMSLIKYFFDANIRDYQGNVQINKEIRETLNTQIGNDDFWWLNNGVTITAQEASFSSKTLHIEDPQIVNGLQTSFEIYRYFSTNKIETEDRNILLRVIKVQDEESRLRVIKATNSQTNIPPASLKATDPIHRDIETYLYAKGFYYDRRKNYHKNQNRPANKIIGIPYLAQIITAILNRMPDYARARPSTLIKNENDYKKIFNANLPMEMYYKGIIIQKEVEKSLKNFNPKLTRAEIGDIKFHVAMGVTMLLTSKIKISAQDIENIDLTLMNKKLIDLVINDVYDIYQILGGTNSVAKGTDFVLEVTEEMEKRMNQK
jgi:hypothetical protein